MSLPHLQEQEKAAREAKQLLNMKQARTLNGADDPAHAATARGVHWRDSQDNNRDELSRQQKVQVEVLGILRQLMKNHGGGWRPWIRRG